jgi:hypothetical protein
MKDVVASLKLKREEMIRQNPDLRKLDLAISALESLG